MWSKTDYIVWTWLNILTTLVIMVLAIEQFTLWVASPFAVLGYAICGWIIISYLLSISDVERDLCIDEDVFGIIFVVALLVQSPLVYYLAWNQWLLTSDMYWLYAPLWVVVYWLIQITYGIAMNFRCVVEE